MGQLQGRKLGFCEPFPYQTILGRKKNRLPLCNLKPLTSWTRRTTLKISNHFPLKQRRNVIIHHIHHIHIYYNPRANVL